MLFYPEKFGRPNKVGVTSVEQDYVPKILISLLPTAPECRVSTEELEEHIHLITLSSSFS